MPIPLFAQLRLFLSSFDRRRVDEELQFHIDRETEANIARGLGPAEARRLALVAFGGVAKSREQVREQRPGYWLETLLQDIRYALRGLRRNRIFTLTVILTLMLGIGSTAAVFSVVDRILFRPLPYGHGDRLVSVGLTAPIEPEEFMLGGSYYEWRDNQQPFLALTSETGVATCDLTEERPERLLCADVEQSFLPTLGVVPVAGRNFTPAEDTPNGPRVALISYNLWKTRFNFDRNTPGRVIHLDGHSVEVVGVLPADFEMPRLQAADILLPQALDVAAQRHASPGTPMWAFARLKPGLTPAQAELQLAPLFNYSLELAPAAFRKEVHLRVRSLRDRQIKNVRRVSWILFGLVLAVLLIACANVAGLLLARSARREREWAMRSALGASRLRLLRQSITESFLLALFGALAASLFTELLLHVFLALAPAGMPYLHQARGNTHIGNTYLLDGRILLFILGASLFCAIFYGLVPALRQPSGRALGTRTWVTAPQSSFRRWLVVAQIAASTVLLVSSALLVRSFRSLTDQTFGLHAHNVVTATISLGRNAYPKPQNQFAFFQQLTRNLSDSPGINAVALSDSLPPGGIHRDQIYASIAVEGRPPTVAGTGGDVAWRWVTPDYFRTLGIPILRGRTFSAAELSSPSHFVVLSRQLATRLFPDSDPVGQQLHLAVNAPDAQNPPYTIVGIAADVKNGGLAEGEEPEYYRLRRNNPDDWDRSAIVLIDADLPAATAQTVLRSQVTALDPMLPVEVGTFSEHIDRLADQPRFEMVLVSFFACTGLALAMVGLYGVVSFGVIERTHEIGVRMALGATRASIPLMVLKGGLRLVLWGTAIGLIAAVAVSRTLVSLLYNTSAGDVPTFAVVTLSMAAIALLATLIPARAATTVDPIVALRCD